MITRARVKRLLSFLVAGTSGFLTDAGLLHLLINHTDVGPYFGRILSIGTAMFVTWQINRNMTFERASHSTRDEGIRYAFIGILSALLNYAIYATLIFTVPLIQPLAAVVAASIAAMGFSYFGYSRFVFGQKGK